MTASQTFCVIGKICSLFLHSTREGSLWCHTFYMHVLVSSVGPGSVVVIATRYGFYGPRIESRWGARFCAPVQTGPGAHSVSYTLGTESFPWVRQPGDGVDHPPHLAPRLKKSRAIPLLPLWAFMACSRVNFILL
jgi:hypothetical protein